MTHTFDAIIIGAGRPVRFSRAGSPQQATGIGAKQTSTKIYEYAP